MVSEPEERGVIIREKPAPPSLPRVTPESIAETKQALGLFKGMVRDILTRGIDFGRIPYTPADTLWDPGASLIISAYGCYAGQRRVLSLRDDEERISVILEVPLLSRATGQEVGTGIGAASTMEAKYKYRWVRDPEARLLGYDDETLGTLKQRGDQETGEIEYRVRNPEHGELLNTLIKMASKRGEVDAAESLPGVASTLRELFDPRNRQRLPKEAPAQGTQGKGTTGSQDAWSRFWGEIARMGINQIEAREILGQFRTEKEGQPVVVESVKEDWVDLGHTLDEALTVLRAVMARLHPGPPPTGDQGPGRGPGLTPEAGEGQAIPQGIGLQSKTLPMHPSTIIDVNSLFRVCNELWKMQPAEVAKEANKARAQDIRPAECPQILAAIAVARGYEVPKQ